MNAPSIVPLRGALALRPTRLGLLVANVAATMLVVGLLKAINLLTLLGFLLVAVGLLNLGLVAAHTHGLRFERRVPRPLTAGTPAEFVGRLEGTTADRRLDLLILDEAVPLVALVPSLAGREVVDVAATWTPPRRGRHRIGPVMATSRYPFGLVEHRREVLPAGEVIVWPALGEIHRSRLTRQLQRRHNRQPVRHRPRPERTAQQEIHGLRPFRLGDSPRLIHWRTSARRQELMVREYEDVPPESLAIVLDATSFGSPEELEEAVSFAATLCWEWCRRRGDRLILGVLGTTAAVLAGPSGPELAAELLDLLAVVEAAGPERTGELLDLLARETTRGGGVLLVSAGPSLLADDLRRALGLSVLALPAAALVDLDGYTAPAETHP